MLEKVTMEDIPEVHKDLAEVLGLDAFKKLVRYVGGSSIYVPVEGCITRSRRNKILKETFKGDYKQLAKTYRISEAHVRRILSEKDW